MTLMSVFLYVSLLSMTAGVVVNLYVAHLDRQGLFAQGDNFDRRCRWAFPSLYLGLNAVAAIYFILFK